MGHERGRQMKAVAMVSSGLDSMLAAKMIQDMGIEVTGLHAVFRYDPYMSEDPTDKMTELFKPTGIQLRIVDYSEAFLPVLLNPAHGYGSCVNPCIDCKIFIFTQAKKLMDEIGASFLFTGEVLGQRPMTQKRNMMKHIERAAGLERLVLRPLCAKHLEPTIPEEEGWVDRNQLLDIIGRGRKVQLAMVKEYGIERFNSPAGGCILTNPQYADRAKALMTHRRKESLTVEDFQLLRLGRHFWPKPYLQIIVGRHEEDNTMLEKFIPSRWYFEAVVEPGPVVLATGVHNQEDIELVAGITARYCKKSGEPKVTIQYKSPETQGEVVASRMDANAVAEWQV